MTLTDGILTDTPVQAPPVRPKNLWRRALRNRRTAIAGGFLVLATLVALLAPLIAPYDYRDMVGLPLSPDGLLGTDDFGRDVFSRLLIALRTTLSVAVSSVIIAGVIGVALGLIAGYAGRIVGTVIMRAIAAVAILGDELVNVVLVIGVLYIPRFTRIVYSQVLALRHVEYVEAAQIMGASTPNILLRTILPNVSAPIIVQVSLSVSFAIQLEAGLSFLGLGAQPPLPSLGSM